MDVAEADEEGAKGKKTRRYQVVLVERVPIFGLAPAYFLAPSTLRRVGRACTSQSGKPGGECREVKASVGQSTPPPPNRARQALRFVEWGVLPVLPRRTGQ